MVVYCICTSIVVPVGVAAVLLPRQQLITDDASTLQAKNLKIRVFGDEWDIEPITGCKA